MMRPVLACLALVALAGCTTGGPPYIAASLPPAYGTGDAVPAGDAVPLSAAKAQRRRSPFIEYPWHAWLADTVRGVRWTVESGDAATVDARGVLHAVRPGVVVLIARAKPDLAGRLEVRVGWPLDSVAFHFAAPEVMVGDTVELVFRRHYATGEVAPRGTRLSIDEPDPVTGGPKHAFTGTVAHEIDIVPIDLTDPRKSDTVAFVARNPGRVAAIGRVQGRELRAELRVLPRAGRTPRFHQASPVTSVRFPDRRPLRCWALIYGRWEDPGSGDSWIPSRPLPAEEAADYAAMPARVELDATPVVRGAPDAGRRIGTMGGDRLTMGRWWQAIRTDSLEMHFVVPTRHKGTSFMRLAARHDATHLEGRVAGGGVRASVTGRAIACDP